MRIIRIQHKTDQTIGIYNKTHGLYECPSYETDYNVHKVPCDDSLLRSNCPEGVKLLPMLDNKSYYFGFTDIGQLRSWLYNDDWIAYLILAGYEIVTYECADCYCIVGYTQVMFKMIKAKIICKEDLESLL